MGWCPWVVSSEVGGGRARGGKHPKLTATDDAADADVDADPSAALLASGRISCVTHRR